MLREQSAHSWLDPVSSLLRSRNSRPPSLVRRLRAEALEDRTVLSTTAVLMTAAPGMTLAEYLAQDHAMGPIVPPQTAATIDAPTADGSSIDDLVAGVSPTSVDQWFATAEGEGGSSGSASGSGSGGGGGSGSGGAVSSGSGGGASSGSGGGAGSGSGGASGSGSGSSGNPDDPIISSATVNDDNGAITVTGIVDDNSGLDGLTMTLDGGLGSITINDDGTFTVSISDSQGNDTFTITVTDSDGNSTTYTFDYPL